MASKRISELQSEKSERSARWSDLGDGVGLSANDVAASHYEDMPSRYDAHAADAEEPNGASPDGVGLTNFPPCLTHFCSNALLS